MKFRFTLLSALGAFGFSGLALAQFESPSAVPSGLERPAAAQLAGERSRLMVQMSQLAAMLAAHNSGCSQVRSDDVAAIRSCQSSQANVQASISRYNADLANYESRLQTAQSAWPTDLDTMTVDARGRIGEQFAGLPVYKEIASSPGRVAWLRGMDAVARRDWELAAAWFGTAKLRDPSNAAIGRATNLAIWTRDKLRSPKSAKPQIVVPKPADLELMRGAFEEAAAKLWNSLSLAERQRLHASDARDKADRDLLYGPIKN